MSFNEFKYLHKFSRGESPLVASCLRKTTTTTTTTTGCTLCTYNIRSSVGSTCTAQRLGRNTVVK
jgi:hypothetical protein